MTAEAIKPVKLPVPLTAVDESIRERVGESAPRPLRLALAKGALPVDPGLLLAAFAYLAQDADEEIAAAAHSSATELPEQFVQTALQSRNTAPEVLGYYSRYFVHDNRYIETLLVNPATPDDAFVYMANELREAKWLDMVSFNQVRYLRSPEIIEAAFYNPDTKMSAVSRMLETAARNGLELGHIPGFREVQATILGEAELKRRRDAGEISPSEFDELMEVEAEDDGMDDEQFQDLLREATEELDEAPKGNQAEPEEKEEEEKVPLWRAISNMKTSQKVRLAILGSASARKILIRDPKKSVATAVLRSPRLTDKEIGFFAAQKGLAEDIIRMIAKNREWTRHYSTKVSLVKNPKTPPQQSMWFLKSLHPKDLKQISKDRDVPGIVAKTAKRMIDQKNSGRKG